MRNYFLKIVLCFQCLLFIFCVSAQKKISGRSNPMQFSFISVKETAPDSKQSIQYRYFSDIDFFDIDSLPDAVPVIPHSVAVVIGVEQYDFIPAAPYASRDARLMARYFKTLFGVEKVLIYTHSDVTGFFFDNLLDSEAGELSRLITKGKTDLYVYYSGHGMPSSTGDELFLLPSDTKLRLIERQGYNLNELFMQLSKYETRSTTLFIDACFSGFGKFSYNDSPVNLTRTKGVDIKPIVNQPWINNPSFQVFMSSSYNQASLVLDEVRAGLFTYFLASGLQGLADLDKDGCITSLELDVFLQTQVTDWSKRIHEQQTPCFFGEPNRVLLKTK